jgi:CDP-diacylglycerol--serine O-phosphatidyltransferase
MNLWRKIIPNLLTLGAMAAALMSIIHAAHGAYIVSAQLIMLALALDGLDGNVARWVNGQTKFGAELDTFIDITAYGIAPAVLAWEMVMKDHGFWGVAFVCFTAMSGAMRLARFRVIDPHRGQQGFLGLPITVNAGWVAMFAIMTEAGGFGEEWLSITGGPLAVFVWSVSLAFLLLQVSTVHYSKPTKGPLFFAAGLLMIMMLFLKQEIMSAAALAIATYGLYFGFVSPFFPRHAALIEVAGSEDEEEEQPADIRPS